MRNRITTPAPIDSSELEKASCEAFVAARSPPAVDFGATAEAFRRRCRRRVVVASSPDDSSTTSAATDAEQIVADHAHRCVEIFCTGLKVRVWCGGGACVRVCVCKCERECVFVHGGGYPLQMWMQASRLRKLVRSVRRVRRHEVGS